MTTEILSEFKIETKPEYIHAGRIGRFEKLLEALKNISGDKCVIYSLDDIKSRFNSKDFKHFKLNFKTAAKNKKLSAVAVEKDGKIYCFLRHQ